MILTSVSAFLVYCVVNAFTPGPGNILALSTAVTYGWKRGLPLYFGIFCGYYVVQALCAVLVFSLGTVLPDTLSVLKWVGCAYVVFLAIHTLRSSPDDCEKGSSASFIQGFVLQFVNAKIYLFGITALIGFVVGQSSDLVTLLAVEMVIATMGCIATLTWVVFGLALQKAYLRHFKAANCIFAAALLLCAVEMLRAA